MKIFHILAASVAAIAIAMTGCSPKYVTHATGARASLQPQVTQYDKFTMDLDPEPITYTIDILSRDGNVKLKGLSPAEAEDLVLVEAIMANRCATLFQPHFTAVVEKGHVLRITVYGTPARYKKVEERRE